MDPIKRPLCHVVFSEICPVCLVDLKQFDIFLCVSAHRPHMYKIPCSRLFSFIIRDTDCPQTSGSNPRNSPQTEPQSLHLLLQDVTQVGVKVYKGNRQNTRGLYTPFVFIYFILIRAFSMQCISQWKLTKCLLPESLWGVWWVCHLSSLPWGSVWWSVAPVFINVPLSLSLLNLVVICWSN